MLNLLMFLHGINEFTVLSGIIFISIVFGIAAGFAREKGRPFLLFFTSLTDIIMIIMNWFMWLVYHNLLLV